MPKYRISMKGDAYDAERYIRELKQDSPDNEIKVLQITAFRDRCVEIDFVSDILLDKVKKDHSKSTTSPQRELEDINDGEILGYNELRYVAIEANDLPSTMFPSGGNIN